MAMNTESFVSISPSEASAITGGGFAYDAGRVIRFLSMMGTGSSPILTALAITDWEINAMLNDPEK